MRALEGLALNSRGDSFNSQAGGNEGEGGGGGNGKARCQTSSTE